MGQKNKYLKLLRQSSNVLKEKFGVISMSLFGSVARDEDTQDSDVDLFVDMPPKFFLIMEMEEYLGELLGRKVDIIRKRDSINTLLLQEIQRDGILVFS